MKKLLFAIFLAFLYSVSAYGQVPTNIPNTVIQVFPGAPTGACLSVMVATRQDTGAFYDCFGGAWAPVGGAGAGANSSLSNLSNPTSVNQSLIPGTTGLTLGTQANPWANVYMQNLTFPGLEVGFFCFPGTLPTPPTGYGGLGCIDANGLLDEYNIGASAWQPLVTGGTANMIDVSATTGAASLDPNIVLTNQTFSLSNPGSFTTGAAILSYENTEVGGCVPDTMYAQVQYNHTATIGKSICNINTTGSGANLVMGLFVATSQDVANVDSNAASLYSFCTVNNCHINVLNPVAQDVSGLTSGVQMTSEEIDIQPYNGPSAYSAGDGLRVSLGDFGVTNPGGTYPFNAFHVTASNAGSAIASPQYSNILNVDASTLSSTGNVLRIGALGASTTSANFNGPIIFRSFDSFYNGSIETANDWSAQVRVSPSSGAATFDELYIFSQLGGAGLANHYFTLTSYQNMTLAFQEQGCGSGNCLAVLGVPSGQTTSSVFNLPPFAGTMVGTGFSSAPGTVNCLPEVSSVTAYTQDCSEIVDAAAGATVGSPTGGAQGAGTLNATNLFVNGVAVGVSGATAWSAITAGANTQTGAFSTTAPWTFSVAGAASTPGLSITGAPFAGTAANSYAQLLVNWNTGTLPSTMSTSGTGLGMFAPSGFGGFLSQWFVGTTSEFLVTSAGSLTLGGSATGSTAFMNNFETRAAGNYAFSSTSSSNGTVDSSLCRSAAGVLEVASSTGCNANGSMSMTNSTESGTDTNAGMISTAVAPTVAAAQIGYGSTTAASTNCGTTPTACIVVNVAGTVHYVPYY